MFPRRPLTTGLTLIELLLVIAVMGILAALVLPSSQPSVHDQLQATARIVATDLAYGRSLAVGNNSNYRFTVDTPNNRLILQYSGTNAALSKLPSSPFRSASDPPDQHIIDLDELPHVGPTVRLVVAASSGTSLQRVDTVEFGPLGQTTRSSPTILWLSAGSGDAARYIPLQVNPVTGLVDVGAFTGAAPPAALLSGTGG